MVNGVLTAELFLPGVTSLKERRHRLKSLREKLRSRFNVAVAEVDGQNTWQRATFAIAAVAGRAAQVHRVFEEVVDFVDGYRDVMLSDYRVDLYGVYMGGEERMAREKVAEGGLALITGGVRSGKSDFAVSLVSDGSKKVVFIATAEAADEEMAGRIAEHRARRPPSWQTVEEPVELAGAVRGVSPAAAVIIDCLGVWTANLLARGAGKEEILGRVEDFLRAVGEREGQTILVTNEVGMGIVPAYPSGRLYRDLLGWVNQKVAAAADLVYFVICGIPICLKSREFAPVGGNFSSGGGFLSPGGE